MTSDLRRAAPRARIAGLLLLVGLVPAAHAGAQWCEGAPSFTRASVQLRANVAHNDRFTSVGGGLRAGRAGGPYAALGAARVAFPHTDRRALDVGAGLGYVLQLGRFISVCPRADYTRQWGPNGDGADHSSSQAAAGLFLGTPVAATTTVLAIPAASVQLVRVSQTTDQAAAATTTTDDGLVVGVGLGAAAEDRYGLRIAAMIPVGLRRATTFYSVVASVGF